MFGDIAANVRSAPRNVSHRVCHGQATCQASCLFQVRSLDGAAASTMSQPQRRSIPRSPLRAGAGAQCVCDGGVLLAVAALRRAAEQRASSERARSARVRAGRACADGEARGVLVRESDDARGAWGNARAGGGSLRRSCRPRLQKLPGGPDAVLISGRLSWSPGSPKKIANFLLSAPSPGAPEPRNRIATGHTLSHFRS